MKHHAARTQHAEKRAAGKPSGAAPGTASEAENRDRAGFSRRGFLQLVMTAGLGLVAANAASAPGIAWADGAGLSREGVKARFLLGSDLHINNNTGAEPRDADKKLQFAFDTIYAIDPQLDAFCLVGDLTDNGTTDQYTRLMGLIEDGGAHNTGYADGAGHTQMILCQGNHETYDPGVAAAPERFKQYTGQDATKVVSVNGVTVITMGPAATGASDGDYRPHYQWLKEQLEDYVGSSTDPFLVLTHHQMQGTSYTSPEWHGNFGQGGSQDLAKLMGAYPNLIQVSGHSHATLEDERSISQDLGFTAIQDSTIGAYYENETGKVDPDSGNGASVPPQTSPAFTEGKNIQEASQCIIIDVMENGTAKVYRVSLVRSKVEGEGTVYLYEPWVIDPANLGAYTTARESTAAPVWPDGAEVTVDNVTNNSASVHFPAAQPGSDKGDDLVHEYKLVAEAEDGTQVVRRIFGDYYRPLPYRRATWDVTFRGLAEQTTYTLNVFAQTSWNKEAGSEGSGTWANSTGPAANSTSAALVSASFSTSMPNEKPRAILDIDYRTGANEDAMGHTATFEDGPQIVDDEELGHPVLEATGKGAWGYALAGGDYDHFAGASTHECLFKLTDNQTDQCLFSNQQQAGAGFEVENGKIEFWYNNESGRKILGAPVETGVWVHAVATFDGENVTLYVNGEQVGQAAAGRMTVPNPNRYYVLSDVSSSNGSEILCKAGTRVAFARIFPYAMTAGQAATAYAASKLAPAPEKILSVDFAEAASGAAVADAAGHEAVHAELAASATIAADESLGQNVFEGDGKSAFGFAFTENDYAYLGNEHALELVFMVHDTQADQCFFSNQQTAGDGLEVAGNGDTKGKIAFWFNSNGSGTPKPAAQVTPDVWHHVLGVYSCGTVRIYLDGKLSEELEATGGLKIPAEGARAFYVGADVTSAGGADLVICEGAKIARAAILSKAPSRDEAAALAAGFPVAPGTEADTFAVTYAWKDGLAPEGVELPVDENAYEAGDTVTLPAEPAVGTEVAGEKDGKAGTWTFEGWDHEDSFAIEADTTVTGTWSFAADTTGGDQPGGEQPGGDTPGGSTSGDKPGSGNKPGGSGTGGSGNQGGSGSTGGTGNTGGTGSGSGGTTDPGTGGAGISGSTSGSSSTGSTGSSSSSGGILPSTGDLGGMLVGGAAAVGTAALGASHLVKRIGNDDDGLVDSYSLYNDDEDEDNEPM